jgi:hypothetical protein
MAMSMRMRMMAMTMSSSINVKPLVSAPQRERRERSAREGFEGERWPNNRKDVQFMGFQCLVSRPEASGPYDKMLQRIDAKGKSNARKAASSF